MQLICQQNYQHAKMLVFCINKCSFYYLEENKEDVKSDD